MFQFKVNGIVFVQAIKRKDWVFSALCPNIAILGHSVDSVQRSNQFVALHERRILLAVRTFFFFKIIFAIAFDIHKSAIKINIDWSTAIVQVTDNAADNIAIHDWSCTISILDIRRRVTEESSDATYVTRTSGNLAFCYKISTIVNIAKKDIRRTASNAAHIQIFRR